MSQYKKYENLPWWLNSLDDNTLTPTQKEVLDLDYYCKKHGTKLSHDQAAKHLVRSRHSVYLARRRLEELGLRATVPAKGSFLLGRPIEYQNEADWLAVLQARRLDPRRLVIKRKSLQKKRPLRGLSSSEVKNVVAPKGSTGVSFPQTPGGSTNRCSGEGQSDSAELRRSKTDIVREFKYRTSLDKLLDLGYTRERAEKLAQIKTDHYMAKREAELKTR